MKTTFAALATVATLSTATFAPLQANAAIGSLGSDAGGGRILR